MRTFMIMAVLLFPLAVSAQYAEADTLSGVRVAYKWGLEKWYKPKSGKVLMLWVTNSTDGSAMYAVEIVASRDGRVIESVVTDLSCLRPRASARGRLNGIVIKPSVLTQEDITNGNFDLEIELSEVTIGERCPEKE